MVLLDCRSRRRRIVFLAATVRGSSMEFSVIGYDAGEAETIRRAAESGRWSD